MPTIRTMSAYSLSILAGMGLWFAASIISGRREAWDAPFYWTVAYPAALFISAGIGYLFPKFPWRWPLTIFFAQFVAMIIRNGEIGSLWPLGMIVFGVLSVPAVLLGLFTAWLRGRFSGSPTQ